MPILNYTTSISTEKTAAEIQKKLAQAKAQAVLCEYDDDAVMSAMSFRIATPHGQVFFRLPANIQGVLKALKRDAKVPWKKKTREQAARVAWRIIKDWVEAQLAIVDAEMADLTEVFLPYAQGADGKTLYQSIEQSGFAALTHDKEA
ncbi:hypothetical protein [Aliikangiella coralliicola]|uniref:Uncharacterized protein n=1 Tax=Aliikangiella coralliicola TaxID=2592383 RepID=A0A545U087_9GAMM|nr:hypothetical protein [Aliikangiella coralliicola]TQV82882.1 hypothetical protein FLL46_24235 [Aliikangiella coralliicola]